MFPYTRGIGPKSSLRINTVAEVTRGVLHSFRHTLLTRPAEGGATATEIRNTGGHADIATSMKYVDAAENARLRELQDANRKGIRAAMSAKPKTAGVISLKKAVVDYVRARPFNP